LRKVGTGECSLVVLPGVRLLFACDSASFEAAEQKWTLRNPWGVVMLPQGAAFPFRAIDVCVYAQFVGGVGECDVAIQLQHVAAGLGRREIKTSKSVALQFNAEDRSFPKDRGFLFSKLPFCEEGKYVFRAVAIVGDEEGNESISVLEGMESEVEVLNWRTRP
jgi:hypothetical protein